MTAYAALALSLAAAIASASPPLPDAVPAPPGFHVTLSNDTAHPQRGERTAPAS